VVYNDGIPDPERVMVLTVSPQLEAALVEQAGRRGVDPAVLALDILRRHLLPLDPPVPADEWERGLLTAATDCGVSLPDSALSSEGLYD
jgi:hypothetical protein